MRHLVFVFMSCFCFASTMAQSGEVWMTPNKGQWEESIRFKMKIEGGDLNLLENGLGFHFYNLPHQHASAETSNDHDHSLNEDSAQQEPVIQAHYIRFRFDQSSVPTAIQNDFPSGHYSNFFLGDDDSKWRSEVRSFQESRWSALYPGVDLVYNSKDGNLKYSWVVAPGANPDVIALWIEGAKDYEILPDGRLAVQHSWGTIFESKPIAFQLVNGEKREVSAAFQLTGNRLTYHLGSYDPHFELVIDPDLTFSSFSGSTADNWGSTATPDDQGNVFGGGVVFGPGLPTTPGVYDATFNHPTSSGVSFFDVCVMKFSANGSNLIYSTYLGGSSNEFPSSMVCAPNGELYVMGVTSSSNFPTTLGSGFGGGTSFNRYGLQFNNGTDIFITRFTASGNALVASRFFGGSSNDGVNLGTLDYNLGDAYRGEIDLDDAGNVYIASSTQSSNFPTAGPAAGLMQGAQSAVAFKLNAGLNAILWSRYISGTDLDAGYSVAIASNGNVYVVGGTTSTNIMPGGGAQTTNAGGRDGFIIRLNGANGTTLSGSYMGQTNYDQLYFVEIDPSGNVYVLGQTNNVYPISQGRYGNPNSGLVLRKYAPNLNSVTWTTMIGAGLGTVEVSPTAFLVSNCFRIYISGWGGVLNNSNGQPTNSTTNGFPVTSDAYQSQTNGSNFWIGVLEADAASLAYATYFGSLNSSSNHVDGGTSRFDKNGNIYHAVCGGCGGMTNGFTTTPGAYSTTNNSSNCNLAVFKFELGIIQALVSVTDPLICFPEPVIFNNFTQNANTFEWDFGDGTTSNVQSPSHVYPGPGTYVATVIVSDSNGCFLPDTTSLVIDIGAFTAFINTPPDTFCVGSSFQLSAGGGQTFSWSPAAALDDASSSDPTVISLDSTTVFTVIITDSCGSDTLSVQMSVFEEDIVFPPDTSVCLGNSVQLFSSGGAIYQWSPSTFLDDPSSPNPVCEPTQNITYLLEITSVNGCFYEDSITVTVFEDPPVPIIPDTLVVCQFDTVGVVLGGAQFYEWTTPGVISDPLSGSTFYLPASFEGYYVCGFINSCGITYDSVYVDTIQMNISISGTEILCRFDTAYFAALGGVRYQWLPNQVFAYEAPVYDSAQLRIDFQQYVTAIGFNALGCSDTARAFVEIYPVTDVEVETAAFIMVEGESATLSALGSPPGGNYIWSPISDLSCPTCAVTNASPSNDIIYTVNYTDTNGCIDSARVDLRFIDLLYIPNTFTPDNDQFNPVFRIVSSNISEFECQIFNRWGELIHVMTKDFNGWDGTYNGEVVQDGVYTWKLTYVTRRGEKKVKVGHVTLLR